MVRKLNSNYDTLEKIKNFLENKKASYEYTIKFDEWDGIQYNLLQGKGINYCLVIKQSAFSGAKIKLVETNVIDIQPIAPSSYINSLTQKGIVALIIYAFIKSSQNKVANTIEQLILEIQN